MTSIAIIPREYTCGNCNTEVKAPKHCGKPMSLVKEDVDEMNWICWKGEHEPCCGRESVVKYDSCCDTPKLGSDEGFSQDQILL